VQRQTKDPLAREGLSNGWMGGGLAIHSAADQPLGDEGMVGVMLRAVS